MLVYRVAKFLQGKVRLLPHQLTHQVQILGAQKWFLSTAMGPGIQAPSSTPLPKEFFHKGTTDAKILGQLLLGTLLPVSGIDYLLP